MNHHPYEEYTLDDLQGQMVRGEGTSSDLTRMYLERIDAIDRRGPELRSVIEINPHAEAIAERMDDERRRGYVRGPLHGIPILLKDNINTADLTSTSAGSLALEGWHPPHDATVAARLREAGAVLLGKANMSEWANFRSTASASGWSARGGQARNPYVLDRSPCGSSSGSASAVAAALVPVSLGTETDGSILCPASFNGVVGIKPTVGSTSRAGVIPIAHSQDTVGPFGLTVRDAATVLWAIAGADDGDPATRASGNTFEQLPAFSQDALRGKRIGVPRAVFAGGDPKTDALLEAAIAAMRDLGAEVVDPADILSATELRESKSELEVLLYEFKSDLNAYLGNLPTTWPVRSLRDLIRFNEEHADREMPHFGQEILLLAETKGPLTDRAYLDALATNHRLARTEGIDSVMDRYNLDALVTLTATCAFAINHESGDSDSASSTQPAAVAGYPSITVPAGFVGELPVGLSFTGRAFSEKTLVEMAHAYEIATGLRRAPQFLG